MSLRSRLAAADPLEGKLPPALRPPALPAGEVQGIEFTGARRRWLPERWLVVAVTACVAGVVGFVAANLVGTSAELTPHPALSPLGTTETGPATTETETTKTATTETVQTATTPTVTVPPGETTTVMTVPPSEDVLTVEIPPPASSGGMTTRHFRLKDDVVLEYRVPDSWELNGYSNASAAFVTPSACPPVWLYAEVVESSASALEQVRGALAGLELIYEGEDGRVAHGLGQDNRPNSLTGYAVVALDAGRWIRLEVGTARNTECTRASLESQINPLSKLLAGVRRR